MIALTLNFKNASPFYKQRVTILGNNLPEIERKLHSEFDSNVELDLDGSKEVELYIGGTTYYAEGCMANLVL